MKRYAQFFSTLAQSVKFTQQLSDKSANLAKIRQEMQTQLKEKLKNPAYKQAIIEAGRNDKENAEALKKAIERSEENFKYSF